MRSKDESVIRLGYGSGYIEFSPSGEFEVLLPREFGAAGPGEVDRALDEPYGPRIEDLSGKSATILVSDATRPSPSHLMVPSLVRRLEGIGVGDILVVFALGTHRRMSIEEEARLLGKAVCFPHLQHDSRRCTALGETSAGTPVEIFEEAASRDLIIATGNIEYHYYAGFSGGAKAVLPGISSEESVIANHMLMRSFDARSGNVKSPVRADMEDASGIAGLDFILNVVLNGEKEIVSAVAGDYVKAHRQGAATVDHMYLRDVLPAEIVVTSVGGSPKDINLFQAQKALDNAKGAAKPGGSIILVARCAEGLGNAVFKRWIGEASSAQDCWERFGREYQFGGHKAAFLALQSLQNDLILVSDLPKEDAKACFFRHARTIEDAIAMAKERQGSDARSLIIPHGGLTLARAKGAFQANRASYTVESSKPF